MKSIMFALCAGKLSKFDIPLILVPSILKSIAIN